MYSLKSGQILDRETKKTNHKNELWLMTKIQYVT